MNAEQRRFWSRVDICSDATACWPWLAGRTPGGYGVAKYGGRSTTAPRIAYFLATGEEPGKLEVCHRCDNPECCNPFHLWLGNHASNMLDSSKKGRAARALTEEQAHRIKFGSERQADLAREFAVSRATICMIRGGKNWAWLRPLETAA